jgi:putative transcription antitermination factor YqgF
MLPALGIDYGRAKIGIALATGPLAEPLSTIPTSRATLLLPKIVFQYNIATLVVGLSQDSIDKEIHKFIINLQNVSSLSKQKIIFQDETLTTHDAINALMHSSPKRRKTREHSVAAAIILQSWLDSLPLGM